MGAREEGGVVGEPTAVHTGGGGRVIHEGVGVLLRLGSVQNELKLRCSLFIFPLATLPRDVLTVDTR